MKKILITGGAGFIGSYLANRLHNDGNHVDVVDNQLRGDCRRLNSEINVYNLDLTKIDELTELQTDYNWIFHLAAVNGTDNFYKNNSIVFEVGVKSCLNIYDYFKHSGASIITASSAEVYQSPEVVPTDEHVKLVIPDIKNPRYSYGGSKIFSELLVMNYGLDFFEKSIIFRPHNIYGPNMGFKHVIPQLIEKINNANDLGLDSISLIGDGSETRAFCHVNDLINGLIVLMESGEDKEIYHIGNDQEITIRELAESLIDISKSKILIRKGVNSHKGGTMRRCPDITKMRDLGYSPTISIVDGIKNTFDWYKSNKKDLDNKLI